MLFKMTNVEADVIRPGDLLVDMGSSAFSTTDTTKEVTTELTEVLHAVVTIKDATPVANDLLGCDCVVTTSAVTVARPAGTTSALAFSYIFIGRKEA